ncbi:hypothetical protein GGX14DRAFT_539425 [Mycena pura]|uniref:Protein kinase domain-containing protein n=1 Tax=Mycena pura TaxID=153505 RepID=A0AAD6YSD1_9AGAR|nr:hypothetical protein GGX14DRAFT_539425 [Mycena pura]
MSFISNASNFTLGEGVYNNIQGNLVNIAVHKAFYGRKRHREEIEDGAELLALGEPLRKRRRREDGIKVIRKKHLKVTGEIGSGPGYLLHFGETKGKAIIVKVFNAGPTVREQLESTVALLKGLIHPNVLQIEGVSSRAELTQFIIYEHAYWKMAEGPLATALKEDLTRSITLGFKMIAGLSSGMNYLGLQGISLAPLGAENFDIFLDIDDRFLISINPRISTETEVAEDQEPEDNLNRAWNVFNAVCQKVLKSANLALHNENIERDPVALEPQASVSQHPLGPSVPVSAPTVESSSAQIISDSAEISVPPRREYVWRTIDRGQQSLATVARRIALEIDMKLTSSVNKLAWTDARSAHRCAGYVREEITLATTSVDSAVISHDAPSPLEICSICREVVGFHEQFRCICGALDPGSRPTVKCVVCKFWSHSDCVGNPKEFTCEPCLPPPASGRVFLQHRCPVLTGLDHRVSSPINLPAMEEEQTRRLREAETDSDDHSWYSDSIEHYSHAQEPSSTDRELIEHQPAH